MLAFCWCTGNAWVNLVKTIFYQNIFMVIWCWFQNGKVHCYHFLRWWTLSSVFGSYCKLWNLDTVFHILTHAYSVNTSVLTNPEGTLFPGAPCHYGYFEGLSLSGSTERWFGDVQLAWHTQWQSRVNAHCLQACPTASEVEIIKPCQITAKSVDSNNETVGNEEDQQSVKNP